MRVWQALAVVSDVEQDAQVEDADRLRVVIVNYRSAVRLRSLLESSGLARHENIVVDNASEPEAVLELARLHGIVPLLLEQNVGFAAAVNHALRSMPPSKLPVLLLNPDVRAPEEELLTKLRQRLDGGRLDGIGPLLRDERGIVPVGVGGFRPTVWTVATYAAFVTHLFPWTRGLFLTRRQAARGRRPDWLCMACLLLKADAFQRFGPIPEDELVYAEDIAWGSAASDRGGRFELAADLTVIHEGGASGGSEAWIGATERMIKRRLSGWRGRLAAWIFRAGLLLRRALGRRLF
jgi:N-acetylglucosaminyl-diphospho-decaprenol L-rhamnosyltransferase